MTASNDKPVILIVDDDVSMRLLMRASLETEFRVEEAEDGREAAELFAELMPSMIISDVEMPDMDGFEAMAAIRRKPGGEEVPYIIVTGCNDEASIERAYQLGVTDFITKPIDWSLLGYRVQYMYRASQALLDLKKSEARNQALIAALPDSIMRVDKLGYVTDLRLSRDENGNTRESYGTLTGSGFYLGDMVDSATAELFLSRIEEALHSGQRQSFVYETDMSGESRTLDVNICACADDEVICVFRDITAKKKAEDKILFLANYDTLTGLPNRTLFREHLKHAVVQARRNNQLVGLMFVDLDRFKPVNDTYGHHVGDLLLAAVGKRLQSSLREGDTVSRLGGDEFTVILEGVESPDDVNVIAESLIRSLAQPFHIEERELFIGASIGMVVFPNDGENIDDLLKSADIAMYRAKSAGRNCAKRYDESMDVKNVELITLEADLHSALEKDQFVLYFQPKVELKSGHIAGMEALLRWEHPELGLVSPGVFVPMLEESSHIREVGLWVLRNACLHHMFWKGLGFPLISVSVNVSGVQFRDSDFVEKVAAIIAETGIDPMYLDLEITESVLMKDAEKAVALLDDLHRLGLTLSVDDFGTGYSSLSYLRQFPVDVLKIDRSFIKDVPGDPDDVTIATGIIALASSLNLRVVAEGVETAEQLAFLAGEGCDEVQGFLFSPPLPSEAFEYLLSQGASFNVANDAPNKSDLTEQVEEQEAASVS